VDNSCFKKTLDFSLTGVTRQLRMAFGPPRNHYVQRDGTAEC